MNSLNSILIEGNVTRDPVMTTTPKSTVVCTFTVESNWFYRENDELQNDILYLDVEVWSRLAERCGEELTEGQGVRIVGRLKQDRWQTKGGEPRPRIKIVAEHVEFRPFMKAEELPEAESTPGEFAEALAAEAMAGAPDDNTFT